MVDAIKEKLKLKWFAVKNVSNLLYAVQQLADCLNNNAETFH